MLETIKFQNEVSAVGRNGHMKMTGIEVFKGDDLPYVTLTPVTSRGLTGNCYIEIPLDQVADLQRMLLRIEMEERGKRAAQWRLERLQKIDDEAATMGATRLKLDAIMWGVNKRSVVVVIAARCRFLWPEGFDQNCLDGLLSIEAPELFQRSHEIMELIPKLDKPYSKVWK